MATSKTTTRRARKPSKSGRLSDAALSYYRRCVASHEPAEAPILGNPQRRKQLRAQAQVSHAELAEILGLTEAEIVADENWDGIDPRELPFQYRKWASAVDGGDWPIFERR